MKTQNQFAGATNFSLIKVLYILMVSLLFGEGFLAAEPAFAQNCPEGSVYYPIKGTNTGQCIVIQACGPGEVLYIDENGYQYCQKDSNSVSEGESYDNSYQNSNDSYQEDGTRIVNETEGAVVDGLYRALGGTMVNRSNQNANNGNRTIKSAREMGLEGGQILTVAEQRRADQIAAENWQRTQRISELGEFAVSPGFMIEFGFGYETMADFIAHLGIGYKFNQYFTLLADVGYAGVIFPESAVRVALTPKANIHVNNFMFSVGLGFGMQWVYHDDMNNYFILTRPVFDFDWFVSTHWFVGFSLGVALFFDTDPSAYSSSDFDFFDRYYISPYMFDWGGVQGEIYFHFGFKI